MFGSVSGGCVEADVAEHAKAVIAGADPAVVWWWSPTRKPGASGCRPAARSTCSSSVSTTRPNCSERGTRYVVVDGEGVGERWTHAGQTGLLEQDSRTVFAEAVRPPLRLVAVSAGDIAEALCALAGRPARLAHRRRRPAGGTRDAPRRVPSADELVVAQPAEIDVTADTAVVSLVHEERLDLPALRAGVERGAFYVGALGRAWRRRSGAEKPRRPGPDGVRGPVGLDLGGETPSEIALEIVAEILRTWKRG